MRVKVHVRGSLVSRHTLDHLEHRDGGADFAKGAQRPQGHARLQNQAHFFIIAFAAVLEESVAHRGIARQRVHGLAHGGAGHHRITHGAMGRCRNQTAQVDAQIGFVGHIQFFKQGQHIEDRHHAPPFGQTQFYRQAHAFGQGDGDPHIGRMDDAFAPGCRGGGFIHAKRLSLNEEILSLAELSEMRPLQTMTDHTNAWRHAPPGQRERQNHVVERVFEKSNSGLAG